MKLDTSDLRWQTLARRRWTARERTIVWRGLTGRFALAIEPLIGVVFMSLLTWGIVYRAHHVASDATLIKIAWIFGLGAIAFGGYFVAVLVAPFVGISPNVSPDLHPRRIRALPRARRRLARRRLRLRGCAFCGPHARIRMGVARQKAATERHASGARRVLDSMPASTKSTENRPGLLPDEELPLLAIGIATRHGRRTTSQR